MEYVPARNVRFVLVVLGLVALVGCGPASPEPVPEPDGPAVHRVVDAPDAHTVLLDAAEPAELALTASQQVYRRAPVVVLAAETRDDDGAHLRAVHAAAAEELEAPALLVGGSVSEHGVTDELERLGARVAVVVVPDPSSAADGSDDGSGAAPSASATPAPASAESAAEAAGVETVRLEVSDPLPSVETERSLPDDDAERLRADVDAALAGAPTGAAPAESSTLREVLALTDPQPGHEAAVATLRAAGAVDHAVPGGDIAGSPESIERIDAAQALAVIGVGPSFGTPAEFAWRVAAAERGDLLPTGTQHLLPARYVSVAGDRRSDPADVVAEAAGTAEAYAGLDGGPVVPTVVVQASAAAGHPTEDGDWVAEEPAAELEPLVDAAREAGQYVLLDVGAGTGALVEEIEPYEDLLARPGVGVALHPEGRRSDGVNPPGQVSMAELRDAIAYIEGVVTNHGLPPAMVVVHQTRPESVVDRAQLGRAAAGAAVEVVVTADRTGAMTATDWVWGRVTDDLPDGVHTGWSGPSLVPYQTPDLVPTDPAPLLVAGS